MSASSKDRNLIAVIGDEVRAFIGIYKNGLTIEHSLGFHHWSITCGSGTCKRPTEEELPGGGLEYATAVVSPQ